MTRPYDQAHELSAIILGTTRSPGVCTITGHDRAKNWDVKKAKGKTGASMTLNGDDPAEFQVSFYLVDDSSPVDIDLDVVGDFDAWDPFQRLIESMTNGPAPFALPIYHPALARQRITEVTSGKVGGMVYDATGGATVVVTFKEYKPPVKKKASSPKAKASAPFRGSRGGPEPKPDPNAAAKAELAALVAQAKQP